MTDLTDEEKKILMPEYRKYLAWFKKWMIEEALPLSFDAWWREYADELKDRAKYQDHPTTK